MDNNMNKKINKQKKTFKYTILRPGGNNQMIIKGFVQQNKKRLINDEMIKRFPSVEQVSFYEYDGKNKTARLELAGGEFCGNATRSLAYLLLDGKKGKLQIKVSGTTKKLKAGIRKETTAYAQMPISSIKSIKKLRTNLFRVDLEGITQLVYIQKRRINNSQDLKKSAFKILEGENLIYSVPAAGVMFINDQDKYIELKPVVWVRDIETLLFETACASGTAAVGIWKAVQDKKSFTKVQVKQPSGKLIEAQIYKKKQGILDVYINGEVEILEKGKEKL